LVLTFLTRRARRSPLAGSTDARSLVAVNSVREEDSRSLATAAKGDINTAIVNRNKNFKGIRYY
jgi:hypothetical protein